MTPPLDPRFQPLALFNREYRRTAVVPLVIGLEGEDGRLSRYETGVRGDAAPDALRYVERLVKFLPWARGGWKLHVGGPKAVGEHIARTYAPRGARRFDGKMMTTSYGRKFRVVPSTPGRVPSARDLQRHARCTVVVDEAAVAGLQGTEYYRWIFENEPEWASAGEAHRVLPKAHERT